MVYRALILDLIFCLLQSLNKLSLRDASGLTTLEGLENLANYTEMIIDNLENLVTMEHLSANLPQDHCIDVDNIGIRDCNKLTNVDGLRIIKNAG